MKSEAENPYPTLRSILHPAALGKTVTQAYGLDVQNCHAIKPHISDIYNLQTPREAFILRVYPHRHITQPEILAELEVLLYLQQRGIPVSVPVQQHNGSNILTLAAPEGTRHAVLFTYAEGITLNQVSDVEIIRAFGEMAARMHRVSAPLWKPLSRKPWDMETMLWEPLSYVEKVHADKADDLIFLRGAAAQIETKLRAMASRNARYGLCHGDLHSWNVHLAENGAFTLFDFEYCGPGWQVYDLAVLSNFETSERTLLFMEGYQKVQELTRDELNALPWMQAGHKIWILGTRAKWWDQLGSLRFAGNIFTDAMAFIRNKLQ